MKAGLFLLPQRVDNPCLFVETWWIRNENPRFTAGGYRFDNILFKAAGKRLAAKALAYPMVFVLPFYSIKAG